MRITAGIILLLLALTCGSGHAASVSYSYDNLNRLTTVTNEPGHVTRYNYDEVGNFISVQSVSQAELVSPLNNSILTTSSQAFAWADTGANSYKLEIGTSAGSHDLGTYVVQSPSSSVTATGLLTNGTIVYVRLWTVVSGTGLYFDYVFTGGQQ